MEIDLIFQSKEIWFPISSIFRGKIAVCFKKNQRPSLIQSLAPTTKVMVSHNKNQFLLDKKETNTARKIDFHLQENQLSLEKKNNANKNNWIPHKLNCELEIVKLVKQPSMCFLRKRCFEIMQQIYRRAPMPKCEFNKVAEQVY